MRLQTSSLGKLAWLPCRLLGFEVVLNKSLNGKNGLEDDLDISLCLGNAKIDYRFVSYRMVECGCGYGDGLGLWPCQSLRV